MIRQFAGRRAHEVFPVIAGPWTGEDPEVLTTGVLAMLRAAARVPTPVAGAVRLIAACARAGLPVAVVTSARRDWACARGKPHPEPFVRGAQRLGLRPGDLVAAERLPGPR